VLKRIPRVFSARSRCTDVRAGCARERERLLAAVFLLCCCLLELVDRLEFCPWERREVERSRFWLSVLLRGVLRSPLVSLARGRAERPRVAQGERDRWSWRFAAGLSLRGLFL
jgi:hypothetical protein